MRMDPGGLQPPSLITAQEVWDFCQLFSHSHRMWPCIPWEVTPMFSTCFLSMWQQIAGLQTWVFQARLKIVSVCRRVDTVEASAGGAYLILWSPSQCFEIVSLFEWVTLFQQSQLAKKISELSCPCPQCQGILQVCTLSACYFLLLFQ